jgi:hypothetical protein
LNDHCASEYEVIKTHTVFQSRTAILGGRGEFQIIPNVCDELGVDEIPEIVVLEITDWNYLENNDRIS